MTGPTYLFSLDIKIPIDSEIFLTLDDLTVIISKYGIYSWNHDTIQFDPFYFTSQEHLDEYPYVYLPNGKFLACYSHRDKDI